MGVEEDSAGESEGFVETDCADEERESLCESDGIDGNAQCHCDGDGEEESKDRRGHDCARKAKVGAECARTGDEEVKGSVHEDVADEDEKDVERVCFECECVETDDESACSVGDPLCGLHLSDVGFWWSRTVWKEGKGGAGIVWSVEEGREVVIMRAWRESEGVGESAGRGELMGKGGGGSGKMLSCVEDG
jgi:hypothetical protein